MNEQQSEEVLGVLNSVSQMFRSAVTKEERAALDARHVDEPEMTHYPAASREEAMLQFTADALKTFADDMGSVLDQRVDRLYHQALEVYYQAEELSREPEHEHLIAHVEAMRRAHEKEYGCLPPPQGNR